MESFLLQACARPSSTYGFHTHSNTSTVYTRPATTIATYQDELVQ